jgi:organic hydroperoxide reductase OsmC/OhrA
MKTHNFKGSLVWTGNLGSGTSAYDQYGRDFEVNTEGKHLIYGSADSAFRGNDQRINPEDFLMNALSSCHMLWYFHLCADNGIVVVDYTDNYTGVLSIDDEGLGRMSGVTLNPVVKIDKSKSIPDAQKRAIELHHAAHEKCFIANSVNTRVYCNPTVELI